MNNHTSLTGKLLLLIALCAALATGIILFGARLGLWSPIVGFGYFREYASLMGYAVTALSLVGLLFLGFAKGSRSDWMKVGIACLIGIALLLPTLMSYTNPATPLPPIHDISTNTITPPQFIVLDDTRDGARNSLIYGGSEVAAQQQAAYPDITPILSELPPEAAFDRAMSIGKSMGWTVVSQEPNSLRFEATARTPIFYFADDVVVVVAPDSNGSRIDIRSVSRIGRGDRGVNAARIRAFITAF